MTEKLTVKDYALKAGVSERTAWRRIKAKRVRVVSEGGKVFIVSKEKNAKKNAIEGMTPIGKGTPASELEAKTLYLQATVERYEKELLETKQENREYRQELKEMRKDLKELTQGVTKALQQSQFIQAGLSLSEGKNVGRNENTQKNTGKKKSFLDKLFGR